MATKPKLLIFNGALAGSQGNTHALLEFLAPHLHWAETEVVTLAERFPSQERLREALAGARGFLFCSGTYWDSWGSPLQRLLENLTEFEATKLLLGKPCAVLISMHSVGGKGVLSRLQGVLSSMGLLIPPMTGFSYSLANHLALRAEAGELQELADDLWRPEDLATVSANLRVAVEAELRFQSWPIDRDNVTRRWL
ncbi:MAG: NAD(P)H-dependent oxidoreductase [Oligoflexia bacterium]|nr:NAD(P)H-dependent oxidoreductase [Oligoflexia bacterium]